jgi:hypothetical protein
MQFRAFRPTQNKRQKRVPEKNAATVSTAPPWPYSFIYLGKMRFTERLKI